MYHKELFPSFCSEYFFSSCTGESLKKNTASYLFLRNFIYIWRQEDRNRNKPFLCKTRHMNDTKISFLNKVSKVSGDFVDVNINMLCPYLLPVRFFDFPV